MVTTTEIGWLIVRYGGHSKASERDPDEGPGPFYLAGWSWGGRPLWSAERTSGAVQDRTPAISDLVALRCDGWQQIMIEQADGMRRMW